GFHDDLGDLTHQPHLVRGLGFAQDPAFYQTTAIGFGSRSFGLQALPISWWRGAESMYDQPVRMHYEKLDKDAHYHHPVLDLATRQRSEVRLVANGNLAIHPYVRARPQVVEFDIPAQATQEGTLDLAWYGQPGLGGNG